MMRNCIRLLWVGLCCIAVGGGGGAVGVSAETPPSPVVGVVEEDITRLIEWIRAEGGVFNHKLDVRRRWEPDGPFAVYTKEDIPDEEVLFHIPRHIIIDEGDDKGKYGAIWCPTVRNLIREMRLADDSKYAPYVNYLLKQEPGQLPSAYSTESIAFLKKLLLQSDGRKWNDLPPNKMTDRIEIDWKEGCDAGDDPFEANAAMILNQRGWDNLLIPGYDMLSHRNGHWLNTKLEAGTVHKKELPVVVLADGDLVKGDELYTSYNFCEDCGGRKKSYGTPSIFRDYGFVEQYPQRWFFRYKVGFWLDQDEDGNISLEWVKNKVPGEKGTKQLQDYLKHLSKEEFALALADTSNNHEMAAIKDYHEALKNAISIALQNLPGACAGSSDEAGVCAVSSKFESLEYEEDETNYAVYVCDTTRTMNFDSFDTIEKTWSHYQKITFVKDPTNQNTCFKINNIWQMCSSYQPFYHEMSVHYTARFLPEIKRVLWVGGGDSMLLHEFLKYQSVELIVGLELDQQITRLTFKHTGTQPHWDNPKVQWWYGDASKTMLMLPSEYFGTFDLVVVDLSETVMSLQVTDGLDIFGALSLLLKPEGLFVKNELYLEKLSKIFDYTLQIHFSGVPVICSQCLVIAGNKVDFMYQPLTDHQLTSSNLYIQPQKAIEDRYEFLHDYRSRNNTARLCDDDSVVKESKKQKKSPGIMMVIEVEECSVDLTNSELVKSRLESATSENGLTVMSTMVSNTEKSPTVTVGLILVEGYVLARAYPGARYVAVDVHFWGSYEKQEPIKWSIVDAFGGDRKKTSSYRIVAGGVFGMSTWKQDEMNRGPRRLADICEKEPLVDRSKKMETDVVTPMVGEVLSVVEEGDFLSVVLCGDREADCKAKDVIAAKKGASNVLPIYACDSIKGQDPFADEAVEKMRDCEAELQEQLNEIKNIRTIFVDPSCPRILAQIFYKIVDDDLRGLLSEKIVVFAVMYEKEEDWRRNLLEKFRKRQVDPMFRSEVFFNSTDSSVEMGVVSSGDTGFVKKLRTCVDTVAEKTGLQSSIRSIEGGLYLFEEQWQHSHFFLPEDYEQDERLKQYMSQMPVAYQTVFQLEPNATLTNKKYRMKSERIRQVMVQALGDLDITLPIGDLAGDPIEAMGESVADGYVFVFAWDNGSCVILFDGRKHLDVNLLTYVEDDAIATAFVENFVSKLKLEIVLKDVQPRGYGGVINFKADLDVPRTVPHWAKPSSVS